jgi:hypothetical protein
MLKRLTVLFAIVVLLLPSGLAAVMWSNPEYCMGPGTMPDCCCTHDQDPAEQGPTLSRECCCEFEAPQPLPDDPEPAWLVEGGGDLDWLLTCPQEQPLPFCADTPLSCELRIQGPPRAPPRPLFLRFQSFLI